VTGCVVEASADRIVRQTPTHHREYDVFSVFYCSVWWYSFYPIRNRWL